jgi:hypothetical protein
MLRRAAGMSQVVSAASTVGASFSADICGACPTPARPGAGGHAGVWASRVRPDSFVYWASRARS